MINNEDISYLAETLYGFLSSFSEQDSVLFVFSKQVKLGAGGVAHFDAEDDQDILLLSNANKYKVDFNNGLLFCGVGNPKYVIRLGVRDLYQQFGKLTLSWDVALASMLTDVFHEMRHVQQYEIAAGHENRPDNMRAEVVWSIVASCDNKNNYIRNYRRMPHEIDAERVGVIDSYEVLQQLFAHENEVDNSWKDTDVVHRASSALSVSLLRSALMRVGPIFYVSFSSEFDIDDFMMRTDLLMNHAIEQNRNIRHVLDANSSDFISKYFVLNKQDWDVFQTFVRGSNQDIYMAKINVEFNDNVYGFFDRSALSFPMNFPEPSGGVVDRPVVVQSLNHNHTLIDDSDIVCSDEQKNSEDIGLSY